jgi:uncharacterized protein (DUF1778 family)
MAKIPKAMKQAAAAEPEPELKDTVTFSVRLTEEQRNLVTKAAELKGWTPTNLLRVAALEKAAYVVNAATLTRVDFKDLARTIATQVFAPRTCRLPGDPDGQLVEAETFESLADAAQAWNILDNPAEVSPWQMPPTFLTKLKDAARFGGTEFLGLILESSEDITSRTHSNLPDPIDPNNL